MNLRFSVYAVSFLASLFAYADPPLEKRGFASEGFRQHDPARPQAPPAKPGPVAFSAPPSDATILLGGTDDASHWTNAKWPIKDGIMRIVADTKNQVSKDAFGDCQLHVEFNIPVTEAAKGYPVRGNSGVFLMGKYEVQIFGSWPGDEQIYADGTAGAIYGQNPPFANALRPAGEWNAFDIVFRRPRFDIKGACVEKATLTVFLNGVLVQDHFELLGPTSYMHRTPYAGHADKLPIVLQEHKSIVEYRNIWVRDLER